MQICGSVELPTEQVGGSNLDQSFEGFQALNEVGHVHGHLVNTSVVEFFNIVQSTFIVVGNKVDGNALTTETATTSDSEKGKFRIRKWSFFPKLNQFLRFDIERRPKAHHRYFLSYVKSKRKIFPNFCGLFQLKNAITKFLSLIDQN